MSSNPLEVFVVYEDKMKCMACSLHYCIYSDEQPDRDHKTVYCPECGTRGASLRLSQTQHEGKFVFQFVGG